MKIRTRFPARSHPWVTARAIIGKVNAVPWRNRGAYGWICSGVEWKPENGAYTICITFTKRDCAEAIPGSNGLIDFTMFRWGE